MTSLHGYLTAHNYITHVPNTFVDVIQFNSDNSAEIGKARLMVPGYR